MMQLLFLDFETYYDQDYSLRKISTPEYILSDKFEMLMCSVALNNEPSRVIDGPDFPKYLAQFDPNETATVTFNSLFDNSILAWRYRFVPKVMIDTIGLARSQLGHLLNSFSLASVSEHLGIGAKGGVLPKMAGLHAEEIKARGWWDEFGAYANQDNELNREIFKRLYPQFPKIERKIMDLVLRTAVEPRFRLDVEMLKVHLETVKAEKAALLATYGGDVSTLMSTAKFKQALQDFGVEIEYKVSPTTGKDIPAFGRTDSFMEDLQEHPDPRVQAIVCARLGHKSTIEETRCLRLLGVAGQPWSKAGLPDHTMPIPLRYGAAHTHRLGGEWKMNFQNMPTARGSKGKSRLRQSLGVV